MALDKQSILQAMALKTETVSIDGGEVIVSEIGAGDWIRLWTAPENQTDGQVDMAKFTPKLVAYSVVDEQGKRIFSDDDVEALARTSQGPFLKIAHVAKRINGLSGEEAKNSAPGLTDSLPSDSV